jgi:WD40 repeat protein
VLPNRLGPFCPTGPDPHHPARDRSFDALDVVLGSVRATRCGSQSRHGSCTEVSPDHSYRASLLTPPPPPDSAKDTKRLAIFSIHVHPDGSRIATGGLDAKVRLWSTKPIINPASEHSNRPPKSLCTLSMHTGPVLTVRWAHSGRWLASGSDDEIVMIWDLDPCVYLYNTLPSAIHIRGYGTG